MTLPRRRRLGLFGLMVTAAIVGQPLNPAVAQTWPAPPIKLVAGRAAGDSLDSLARRIALGLSPLVGQSVVVDNKPGAGGVIAEQLVAKSEGDGYTLLIDATQIVVNDTLRHDLPFDPTKDRVPVATLHRSPFLVVAGPALKVRTVQELVEHAKRQPGSLNFAYTEASTQLGVEAFRQTANVDVTTMFYPGWSKASIAMLHGDTDITIIDVASPLQLIKDGRLRSLAIAGERRTPLLPDLPTIAEAGLPSAEAGTGYMILAPAGTPLEPIKTAVVAAKMPRQ